MNEMYEFGGDPSMVGRVCMNQENATHVAMLDNRQPGYTEEKGKSLKLLQTKFSLMYSIVLVKIRI